ncbi:NAD-dependent epimerase/dehydratase family protein [Membranihabitans marinus]|uniref:NAD-dependent epimerase/dehydratase family protein n=1 Tax=Membranihabitans marinus TaxID=1227546 RepID=UPI001F1FE1D6|nr:NAD(P)-dependent oxidoreductase [Membranihabitans marinus]
MNILVTGGAGYIGTSLVEALHQNPEVKRIVIYDNMSHNNIRFFFNGVKLDKVEFVQGDILNHIELMRVLQDIDAIYHLAGVVKSPYSHEDSLKYEQINLWGTANLVQCLEKNTRVQKFIFLSTASVYGFHHVENELMEPNPMNAYGRSKREAEKFIQLLANRMIVDVLRIGNVYGYNRAVRLDSVINRFIFEALCYGKIKIYGDGEQKRPFIHIDSLSKALMNTLPTGKKPGYGLKIHNLVDFNISINQIRFILREIIPNLEYIHINQGQKVPSLEVNDARLLTENKIEEALINEVYTFSNHFILNNQELLVPSSNK